MPGRQGLVLVAHDCEPTVQLLASVQAHDSYAVALTLPETLRRRAVHILARMLREDGFLVSVAEGSREAMSCLARTRMPEALVFDVSLPPSSYLPVLNYARQLHPSLPLFLLSTDRSVDESEWPAGPSPMLMTKPIDYSKLRLELTRVLRSHTGQMLRVFDVPRGVMSRSEEGKK